MDPRNLDARDLEAMRSAGLELQPAVPTPEVSRSTAAPDPELPTTIEQLRNIVRLEAYKAIPSPDEFRALIKEGIREILSTVPRGEA